MSTARRAPVRRACMLLALLALVLRLTVPGVPWPNPGTSPTAELARLLGSDVVLCHSDVGPAIDIPASGDKPTPHPHDCALCPACHLAAAPALLPGSSWVPGPVSAQLAVAFVLPPSTGPPPPARDAHPPRGPPASA